MIWVDFFTCSNIKETKMNARVKFNWCFTASVVSGDVATVVAADVDAVVAADDADAVPAVVTELVAAVIAADVAAAVADVVSVVASYVVAQLKVIWGYCRVFVKSSSIKKFKNFVPA